MGLAKETRSYLFGIIILGFVLSIAIFSNEKSNLTTLIENYAQRKQEITDTLGLLKSSEWVSSPWVLKKQNSTIMTLQLNGKDQDGRLQVEVYLDNGTWRIKRAMLVCATHSTILGPTYVDNMEFYASTGTQPLAEPVFDAGEGILLRTTLKGLANNLGGSMISQNLKVYDSQNTLVASRENAATFSPSPNFVKDAAVFTNQLHALKPGDYQVQMQFQNQNADLIETYWQKIKVGDAKHLRKTLSVAAVDYFADTNLTKPAESVFVSGKPIYYRLKLDGLSSQENRIMGDVEVKVTNADGKVIVPTTKLGRINRATGKSLATLKGRLVLDQPDVYFLNFKIRDAIAKKDVLHNEKVVVKLDHFTDEESMFEENLPINKAASNLPEDDSAEEFEVE